MCNSCVSCSVQEAVAVCVDAQLFTEAKEMARGNPILQQAVQESEAAYLMQHADADELAAAGAPTHFETPSCCRAWLAVLAE